MQAITVENKQKRLHVLLGRCYDSSLLVLLVWIKTTVSSCWAPVTPQHTKSNSTDVKLKIIPLNNNPHSGSPDLHLISSAQWGDLKVRRAASRISELPSHIRLIWCVRLWEYRNYPTQTFTDGSETASGQTLASEYTDEEEIKQHTNSNFHLLCISSRLSFR